MKIDAPVTIAEDRDGSEYRARIIREGDWRKIMAVIKEVDLAFPLPPSLFEKVEALRRHLSKK